MKKLVIIFLCLILLNPSSALAQSYFANGVSSDTNTTNGTNSSYTTGFGPVITETGPGQISTGTLILNAPGNYVFNPNTNVTLSINGDTDANKNILASVSSVTTTQVTVTINRSSTGDPNRLRFQGLQIRPVNGQIMMMDTSQLYFTGSSINGTDITENLIKQVPGRAASFIGWANDTMVTHSGDPFHIQVFATDAYRNFTKVLTDTPFRLAVKAGTGILLGNLNGTIMTGNNNVILPSFIYTAAELNILLSIISTVSSLNMTEGEILFSSLQGSNPIVIPTPSPSASPSPSPSLSPEPTAEPSSTPSPTASPSPSSSPTPNPTSSPSVSNSPSASPSPSPTASPTPSISPSPSPEVLAPTTRLVTFEPVINQEDVHWQELYVDPNQIINTAISNQVTYINELSFWQQIQEILSFRIYQIQWWLAQILWVGTEGFEPPTSSV